MKKYYCIYVCMTYSSGCLGEKCNTVTMPLGVTSSFVHIQVCMCYFISAYLIKKRPQKKLNCNFVICQVLTT